MISKFYNLLFRFILGTAFGIAAFNIYKRSERVEKQKIVHGLKRWKSTSNNLIFTVFMPGILKIISDI